MIQQRRRNPDMNWSDWKSRNERKAWIHVPIIIIDYFLLYLVKPPPKDIFVKMIDDNI